MKTAHWIKGGVVALSFGLATGCSTAPQVPSSEALAHTALEAPVSRELARADGSCRNRANLGATDALAVGDPSFDRYRYCMRGEGFVLRQARPRTAQPTQPQVASTR